MMNFREEIRYEYPLDSSSFVIDAGGFQGRFAAEIARRYHCKIVVYEPIFTDMVIAAVGNDQNVTIVPTGIAGSNRSALFFEKGDMTGLFAEGAGKPVTLIDIVDAIDCRDVALLKLNIEGMEFEVLERLLDEGEAIKEVQNIQVQFHPVVENAAVRYQCIRDRLLTAGYHLTFDFPWCWQNYART